MKSKLVLTLGALLVLGLMFAACDNGTNDNGTENPFVGIWIKDYSGGSTKVTVTEDTWSAKHKDVFYNGGTYTYSGTPSSVWTVTDKGQGSAEPNETGNAAIANGKMTISDFSDSNMNGSYSR
jgi:hypothetical protein